MTKPDRTPEEAERRLQLLLKVGFFVAVLWLGSVVVFIATGTHDAGYLLLALFCAMVGLMWPVEP